MATTQEMVSKTIQAQIAVSGITHQDLAEAIGLSRNTLYRRLKGFKAWNIDDIDKVAKFFGFNDAYAFIEVAKKTVSQFKKPSPTEQSLAA